MIKSNNLNNMIQTLKKISAEQSIQFSYSPSPSHASSLILFKLKMEGTITHANVPCVVLTKINMDRIYRLVGLKFLAEVHGPEGLRLSVRTGISASLKFSTFFRFLLLFYQGKLDIFYIDTASHKLKLFLPQQD